MVIILSQPFAFSTVLPYRFLCLRRFSVRYPKLDGAWESHLEGSALVNFFFEFGPSSHRVFLQPPFHCAFLNRRVSIRSRHRECTENHCILGEKPEIYILPSTSTTLTSPSTQASPIRSVQTPPGPTSPCQPVVYQTVTIRLGNSSDLRTFDAAPNNLARLSASG